MPRSLVAPGYTRSDLLQNKRLSRCLECHGDIFFYDGCWHHEQYELDESHEPITRKVVRYGR